jgi:toxin ParE1/3/4
VKRSRLRLTEVAVSDILEQADWYDQRPGQHLAKQWEEAVLAAIERLTENPHSGAPCHFSKDELHGIRRISIPRFPKHSIFYQAEKHDLMILRVAHGARDLETLF